MKTEKTDDMKNRTKTEIPEIIELTEEEVEERKAFFIDSTKDEDGLIETLEKHCKETLHCVK